MLASLAYCLRMSQKPWRVRRSPRRFTKRADSLRFFTRAARPSFRYAVTAAAACSWMGIVRSFEPLPMQRTYGCGPAMFMSSMFSDTSSVTRRPVA